MTFRHDCQKCTTAFGMRYPCSEHGSQDPEHDPSCLCRDCCPAPGDPCTDCGEALRVSFVERGSVESGPTGLDQVLVCGCPDPADADHDEPVCKRCGDPDAFEREDTVGQQVLCGPCYRKTGWVA